jgi:Na+-driven multidrug efflux pump
MAAAILVGQSIGARNQEQAKRVVGNGAAFFIVGSIAIASSGALFTRPLLTLMQTPDDAMPFAVAYLRIIFAGIPFLFLYTFVMMVLRGAGDSKTPFWFLLLSVALDIALNPLLIFGVGRFPRSESPVRRPRRCSRK